jgi:hypothetical protein
VFGVERYLAWLQTRRPIVGLSAAVLLGLAVLTRINLIVLIGLTAICTFVGARRLTPLAGALGVAMLGFLVTRDPEPLAGTTVSAATGQLRLDRSAYNLIALAVAYVTTTPLLAALRSRHSSPENVLLWSWLLVPLPIIAYVHVAPKYLLPALPAVAILAASGLENSAWRRTLLTIVVGLGAILGALILSADARMSGGMRLAAKTLIRPQVEKGERVWFAGHWGFHWYAEKAGAQPMSLDPPYPEPGDLVVGSLVDEPQGLLCTLPRDLISTWGDRGPTGYVMNRDAYAGFYSNYWGLLPWSWGSSRLPPFAVWRVADRPSHTPELRLRWCIP